MPSPTAVLGPHVKIGQVVLSAVILALACQSEESHPDYVDELGSHRDPAKGVDYCATPNEGCECVHEGEVVDCGTVKEVYEDYIICSEGTRTCTDGKWGPCYGETSVQRPLSWRVTARDPLARSKATLALGGPSVCSNACDPHCTQQIDAPGDFDAGTGFDNSASGLTLERTALVGCESLTITPSATTTTVTGLGTAVTATPVSLTAALSPDCMDSPFPTAWTVDRFDIAQVTGSDSSNGVFRVVQPIAGDVTVTAYAAGLSASVKIHVNVNVTESVNVAPNLAVSPTVAAKLVGSGTATSRVTWLYPYAQTYFPLGLLAPVVQYWFSSEASGGTAKVSLRYPAGSTLAKADFNYSIIVKETNSVSNAAAPTAVPIKTTDPQVVIPQAAWKAFEQTARGKDADLVIQRLRNDGTTLEVESARTVHLVNGQLKGTVFYNSYSSQMGGVNTGAVLAIKPGASSPSLAVQPSGKCAVCHTINADGTKLIAAGTRPSGGVQFNNSRRYDISNPSLWPSSSPVLNSYNATGGDVENISGDRFNFGAVWKDGSLYMSHGGSATYNGDNNWRAPPDYSRLYNPTSDNPSAIAVANWTNISAVTPKFSMDGTKIAFGFWGRSGSVLPQTPSGTLSADTSGRTLVVADFGCSTSTCTGSSTGWKVTNARSVTPGLSYKVGWPSFLPDGSAVVYQQQYRSSKPAISWSPSDINTVAGALAEIWMSNVPADKNGAAVPTRLRALNGLDPSGSTSYLPRTPASPAPSYHAANAAFTINQADDCSKTANLTGINDYQLNYLPAMAPVKAGGMNWVVFTSRRMYGNIAYNDPWDAEPGPKGCLNNSVPCTCSSGTAPTKKLWIAAIDGSFTPGSDPSHPAFYLPGQELMAGNSDGYWVAAQCSAEGQSCSTSDDCCGGSGTNPTTRCSAISSTCQAVTSCQSLDSACSETADCCAGLVCGGTGTCVNPLFFAAQTYRREYIAECPEGTQVVWRFFEWQATIPVGTMITLGVQTKRDASDSYTPVEPAAMDPIVTTSPDGVWVHGTKTVDYVLRASSSGPGVSRRHLLVSLTFLPDATGTLAPTLKNWRQVYDCLDAE